MSDLLVVLVVCGALYCVAGVAASAMERYELMKRQRSFNTVSRTQSNVWGYCEACGEQVGDCHLPRCQEIYREVLANRERMQKP
jgi:hypothetical protein